MSESPSVTDPYLQSLLDAADEVRGLFAEDRDKMRGLILKAYQQGRNKVIRDINEERTRRKEPSRRFAEMRVTLDLLERDYMQCLAEPRDTPLTAEQMVQVLGKVQEALLNQARKNRT